jgi:hypothetical protein
VTTYQQRLWKRTRRETNADDGHFARFYGGIDLNCFTYRYLTHFTPRLDVKLPLTFLLSSYLPRYIFFEGITTHCCCPPPPLASQQRSKPTPSSTHSQRTSHFLHAHVTSPAWWNLPHAATPAPDPDGSPLPSMSCLCGTST